MTPSEQLVAAADRVRDLAAAATPPPWEIEYDYSGSRPQALWRMDPEQPGDVDASLSMGAMGASADNAWVAALSPAVAPHLERWLRMAAEDYERRAPLPKVGEPNPHSLPVDLTGAFGPTYWSEALALAELICPELGVGSQ